jgi:hypothetical protein
LKLIQELQAEGLNLQAIGWLLGGAGGVDSDELRRLKRSMLDSWVGDEPIELTVDRAARGFGRTHRTPTRPAGRSISACSRPPRTAT